MPKRILVVLDTYPALSETFLYTYLENLTKTGFDISIRARRRGSSPHLMRFKDVKYLPSEELSFLFKMLVVGSYALNLLVISPISFMRAVRYLRRQPAEIRQRALTAFRIFPLLCEKADAVYLSFGGLAVKYLEYIELNRNVVFSLRGSDINIEPLLSEMYAGRLKSAIHAARRVHCVCEDIKRKAVAMSGEAERKFSVIFTAVHPLFLESFSTMSALSGEGIRIISVGRLDWRKGFEHGIVAIRNLVDRGIQLSWTIIGDGEYRAALLWAIRDMGLTRHVMVTGGKSQETIRNLLCQSEIFFHPAVHEGISNAVVEAMAVGLPVVVSDVGGMPEAVEHGKTGFLVKPRDWKAMADVLERLAQDHCLRQTIGRAAQAHVREHLTSANQKAGFEEFFRKALSHD